MARVDDRTLDPNRAAGLKAGLVRALFVACLLSGVVAAEAAAAPGDLIQKPGAAGCLSVAGFCSPATEVENANSVAVSPDGRSVYVGSSEAVAVFNRDSDGTLAQKRGVAGCISETGAGRCGDGAALDQTRSVAVSPDGQSVYVASIGSDAVVVFDRGPNGTLTQKPGAAGCISDSGAAPCGDGAALDGAETVAVSPDGQTVYVSSLVSDAVVVFDRALDGTLAQQPGAAGCISDSGAAPCGDGAALDGARSVAVSPDGQSVYAASGDDSAVAVFNRGADGTLAQKRGVAGCISETGDGRCADGTALSGAEEVTVSPDGHSAYVTAEVNGKLAMFDRAPNGTLAQKPAEAGCISDTGTGPCVDGTALGSAEQVTVSPDGQSAYVAAQGSDAAAVFDRAPNGTLAQKPAAAGCISETGAAPCSDGAALDGAASVAVSPDGQSAYVASTSVFGGVAVFDREPIPASRPRSLGRLFSMSLRFPTITEASPSDTPAARP